MRPRALAAEAGATLVEVLAAVALMGIAFLTILGGMLTSSVGADIGRKQAEVDAALRSYAVSIEEATYVDCADEADFSPAALGFTPPEGVSVSVEQVRYWDPANNDPSTGSFKVACPSDQGLQRVTIEAVADDERAITSRQIVKRRP